MTPPTFIYRLAGLAFVVFLAGGPARAAVQTAPEDVYQEGLDFLTEENWTAAAERFEAVLDIDAEHVPSWFNLAFARARGGDREGAIQAYRQALSLDPDLYEARMNLSFLLQGEGRTAEALAEVTEGARLRPSDPVPALYRAQLLDRLDRVGEAADAYRLAIGLDPDSPDPYWRLGSLLERTGRKEEARDALAEAARLGSMEPGVFLLLGDLALEAGKLEEARDAYRRAMELDGEDREVRMQLARVLLDLGEYPDAIGLLEQLDDSGPLLAEAYARAGRFEAARDAYRELVEAEPANAEYWLALGKAFYELEMPVEAQEPLRRALALDPALESGWGTLAAIYYQSGDFANAATMLLNKLELSPDDALTHFMLATSLDNLENYEQALLHYNEFLQLDDGANDARTFQVRQRRDFIEKHLLQ